MSRARGSRRIQLRLAFATAALAAFTVALGLGGVYWWTMDELHDEADAWVERELAELVQRHAIDGHEGLAAEIRRRIEITPMDDTLYVFAESSFEAVVGSMAYWPRGVPGDTQGVRTIAMPSTAATPGTQSLRFVARTLADGRHLLVGEDWTEEADFERSLRLGMLGALAVAVLLALSAGLTISHRLLGRIEAMNTTILRILAGRRGERVAVGRHGDEFDALAGHFNRLLDENDRLLARMREVTNDIAHDLRTPLARMRTHIESALAAPPDAERSREALADLLGETQGVLDTFNALLQIAQIESRAVRESMEPIDLAELVEGAVDLYQPLADEAGIELTADTGAGLQVPGNRHLLAQALANLIDNAIKYGGPGQIYIQTARRGGRVELSVRDRGPGIPAADRERVLERFVRLDGSRHQPGTGLGLSFVAAVAGLHDAALSLDDTGPGLRVTLTFEGGAQDG